MSFENWKHLTTDQKLDELKSAVESLQFAMRQINQHQLPVLNSGVGDCLAQIQTVANAVKRLEEGH